MPTEPNRPLSSIYLLFSVVSSFNCGGVKNLHDFAGRWQKVKKDKKKVKETKKSSLLTPDTLVKTGSDRVSCPDTFSPSSLGRHSRSPFCFTPQFTPRIISKVPLSLCFSLSLSLTHSLSPSVSLSISTCISVYNKIMHKSIHVWHNLRGIYFRHLPISFRQAFQNKKGGIRWLPAELFGPLGP